MQDLRSLIQEQVPPRHAVVRRINFTPTLTSLTEVGTVTKTGSIRVIGDLVFFSIKLDPEAASSLASTLGVTYVSNLPYTVADTCGANVQNTTAITSLGDGIVQEATTRIYLPTIGATADTVTINGWYVRTQ